VRVRRRARAARRDLARGRDWGREPRGARHGRRRPAARAAAGGHRPGVTIPYEWIFRRRILRDTDHGDTDSG